MIDFKRISYLFLSAMLIGLALVHVRSSHLRAVYETTRLLEQHRQVERQIWGQQVRLTRAIESPTQIKQAVERLGLRIQPPGHIPQSQERLAKKTQ
jgi:hypothetical protein